MTRLGVQKRQLVGGFTLVELLVALTISSIVILAICSVSRAGWLLWRRVEDRRPIEQQAGSVIETMRAELAGLYLPGGEGGVGPGFVHFENRERGEQMIWFCTTTPSYRRGLSPGRCAKVTYEYRTLPAAEGGEQQGRGGILIRREQLLAGEEPIAEPTAEVIARNLASLALECLGPDGKPVPGDGANAGGAPHMVRLQMMWAIHKNKDAPTEAVTYSVQFLVPVDGQLREAG